MPFTIVENEVENESEVASTQIVQIPSHVAAAGDALINAQPGVSDHAIAQHEERVQEVAASAERDKNGVAFDASIHSGSKLKDGAWRLKKAAKGASSSVAKPAATAQAGDQQARIAGGALAGMVCLIATRVGGEEWAPQTLKDTDGKDIIDERVMLREAFGDYCIAKNVRDVPAGAALCFALMLYAAPRFAMPKTQERTKHAYSWIAVRFAKWRVTRELKKRGIVADVTIHDTAKAGEQQKSRRYEVMINGKLAAHYFAWGANHPVESVAKK